MAPGDMVLAWARKEDIGAAVAEEIVVAAESAQRVVAPFSFEGLVPVAAEDEIVAVGAVDEPVLRLVVDRVGSNAAEDGAPERVAQDRQGVAAVATFELCPAERLPSRERSGVVALTTVDAVISLETLSPHPPRRRSGGRRRSVTVTDSCASGSRPAPRRPRCLPPGRRRANCRRPLRLR